MGSKQSTIGQNDNEAILGSYQDAVKQLYGVLGEKYVAANGDSAATKKADVAFVAGLTLARSVRDRALALASG
jgi:hypothetical protein